MKILPGIVLAIIFLISACSSKVKKDTGVLPVDKMQKVMWDMIKADQYVTDFVAKDSTKNKDNEMVKLYDAIFTIHKTNRAQFKKSMDYYVSNPELLQPIMDSLARKQREVYQPRTIFKRDSIIKDLPKVQPAN